jgi:hypothetical protein
MLMIQCDIHLSLWNRAAGETMDWVREKGLQDNFGIAIIMIPLRELGKLTDYLLMHKLQKMTFPLPQPQAQKLNWILESYVDCFASVLKLNRIKNYYPAMLPLISIINATYKYSKL